MMVPEDVLNIWAAFELALLMYSSILRNVFRGKLPQSPVTSSCGCEQDLQSRFYGYKLA